MNCPVDNNPLVMAERQGIEIDYCPTCRGVWLDRGELDKLIERSAVEGRGRAEPEGERAGNDERSGGRKRKRESFLGDIFDFGG